jgi:hypothetical protein
LLLDSGSPLLGVRNDGEVIIPGRPGGAEPGLQLQTLNAFLDSGACALGRNDKAVVIPGRAEGANPESSQIR